MEENEYSTSPDPISILADSSPAKSPRRSTALTPIPYNTVSPRKSVVLDATDADGRSPWRIKVTVEAEPRDNSPGRINRNILRGGSITVPLKSADNRSPIRTRSRSRKSSMVTTRSATSDMAEPSQPRRRGTPARRSQIDMETAVSVPRRRSRRSQVSRAEDKAPEGEPQEQSRPSENSAGTSNSTPLTATIEGKYNLNDEIVGFDDVPQVPGDATTIESEQFSMISVDSLSSRQPTVPRPSFDAFNRGDRSQHVIDTTFSYMPSSPPVYHSSFITPQMAQTPDQPPAPPQSAPKYPTVLTPLRESAVRTGKVLQDIVRSPERQTTPVGTQNGLDGLFAGFSANTRRQLRQSLQVGMDMSKTPQSAKSVGDRTKYPILTETRANNRLLTPDEGQEGNYEEKSLPKSSNEASLYPRIMPALLEPSSHISRRSYEAMSWAPNGPPESKALAPSSMMENSPKPLMSPASLLSHISVRSDTPESSTEDKDKAGQSKSSRPSVNSDIPLNDSAFDIWQEEASRDSNHSVIERNDSVSVSAAGNKEHQSTQRSAIEVDVPIHRAIDTDLEQTVEVRKASSSTTSSYRQGISTPSSSEEDDEKADANDTITVNVQTAPTQADASANVEDSSDADDTGLFWQANMRNVQQRIGRQRRVERSVISEISELKPISSPTQLEAARGSRRALNSSVNSKSSSWNRTPAMNTSIADTSILDESTTHDADQSESASEGPIYGDESEVFVEQEEDEEDIQETEDSFEDATAEVDETERTYNESTVAHARQLQAEMADHIRQDLFDRAQGESGNVSWLESTDINTSRSYVERLNLSSPTKVKVKFNDSSAVVQNSGIASRVNTSVISPQKKKYASLFEEDAPLGARDVSESMESVKQTSSPASSPRKSGLLSQMASTIWETVTSSPFAAQLPKVVAEESVQSSPAVKSTPITASIPTVSDLTLRLRRKYGLLSSTHPFTMAHARTLNRLHNSTVQHPDVTLVPLTGPLPVAVVPPKTLGEVHVRIAAAFMALLVPADEQERLEAQGGWGDELAETHRGWDSKGRHGEWFAFPGEKPKDKAARAMRGDIEIGWVLEVLVGIARKEAAATARR